MTNTNRIFLAMAITWTLAIMVVCWVPISVPVFKLDEEGWLPFLLPDLDKMVHFGIFSIFAILWFLAIPVAGRSWMILVAAIALATITELVQKIPMIGRSCDFDDALYDVFGVLFALAFMIGLRAIVYRKTPKVMAPTTSA